MRRFMFVAAFVVSFFSFLSSFVGAQSMQVVVDLTDAPRNLYHSQLTIPVKPGPLTLVYPKWIPGNHRPSGPIANVTGVKMEAGGQTLVWERDPVDMYAFHVDVPAGANELDLGKGAYVVLGFIPEDLHVATHVNLAQASGDGGAANLDWFFE